MEDFSNIDKKREIIDVAGQYGEHLSTISPQVKNNRINYYFAGSLAMMLYASAKKIEYCQLNGNEIVNIGEEKEVTKKCQESLTMVARKIGDLDIVQIGEEGLVQKLENPIPPKNPYGIAIDSNTKYFNSERYTKEEIPNIDILHSKRNLINLYNEDALYGNLNNGVNRDRVCRLTTNNGKIVYVASPETIIAQKLNRAIRYYGTEFEEQKDIKDLALFINGISDIYDEAELSNRVAEAWMEMKKTILMNDVLNSYRNGILEKMYNQMKEISSKEGIEDTRKLGTIFAKSVGNFVNLKRQNVSKKKREEKSEIKRHDLDEFHDVAINDKSEATNDVARETKKGLETEGEMEQDDKKNLGEYND